MAEPTFFRVELLMQAGKYGWGEDHAYKCQNGDKSCKQVIAALLGQVVPARARLLGQGASMIGVRVSTINSFRDVETFDGQQSPATVAAFNADSPLRAMKCDNPYSCTILKIKHQVPYISSVYVRGLPASMQVFPSGGTWTDDMYTYWNRYRSVLLKPVADGDVLGAMLLGGRPSPTTPANIRKITTALGVPPTLTLDTGVAFPTLKQGQFCRIKGVKGDKGVNSRIYNGKFQVNVQTDTLEPVLRGKVGTGDNVKLDCSKAVLWIPQTTFFQYLDCEWSKLTHRKTGIPFGKPAGRSRTRS